MQPIKPNAKAATKIVSNLVNNAQISNVNLTRATSNKRATSSNPLPDNPAKRVLSPPITYQVIDNEF